MMNREFTKFENETRFFIYWAINNPSVYIILDHLYEAKKDKSLDDLFWTQAFVKYDGPMVDRILQNRDRWTRTWFGYEVFDFELPKPPKVKKQYKEKKVKHLTFTLGDALKESGF